MDKKATPNSTRATATAAADAPATPRPVRSAKEAINAMYAEQSQTNLSDYLAASAKEIINSKSGKSKSAANLHHNSSRSRLEARPSASGMLRTAKVEKTPVVHDLSHAMDPLAQKSAPIETIRVVEHPATPEPAPAVVKTSLRLKKTPVATKPQALQQPRRRTTLSLNGQKGETTLSKLWAERRAQSRGGVKAPSVSTKPQPDAHTTEALQVMQQAVQQTTGTNPTSTKSRRTSRGQMQDIIRPPRTVDGFSRPQPLDFAESPTTRPRDSVKRRFKPAPKGYTSAPEVQDSAYQSPENDILNRNRPPVEIYGMMEEDYTTKDAGFGIVEDYQPTSNQIGRGINEQKIAQGRGSAAPDNNKYALGGQSPFFLKSVSVEKRPLSEGPRPSKIAAPSEGTLYERPDAKPLSGKNVYEKKPAKKPLPTKPTVIIPAARKSKAPLIFLLILTIILGAAVGAFAYLCFFQYME